LRSIHPNKRSVTWCNNNKNNLIGCRLDRIYIPRHFKDLILKCDILPSYFSDHNFVFLKLKLNGTITFGKSYWKLNNSILDDETFIENFAFYWQNISRTECYTLEWWDKMKLLIKEFCIDYSKSKNKETFSEINKLRSQYKNATDLLEKEEILSKH
jgi:hypothetical protein